MEGTVKHLFLHALVACGDEKCHSNVMTNVPLCVLCFYLFIFVLCSFFLPLMYTNVQKLWDSKFLYMQIYILFMPMNFKYWMDRMLDIKWLEKMAS